MFSTPCCVNRIRVMYSGMIRDSPSKLFGLQTGNCQVDIQNRAPLYGKRYRAYKIGPVSGVREGGETPPLPRNCKHREVSKGSLATGMTLFREGAQLRLRCKSGDRPDHFQANPASMGELESIPRGPVARIESCLSIPLRQGIMCPVRGYICRKCSGVR